MLEIYAGKTALKTIKEQGFKQELFTSFLGASGGPKWFVLYCLDRYLFGEFFKDRTQTLNLIGSSAGSFRSSCFAQNDPLAAIERLATSYSETTYSANADAAEITGKARELLNGVFGSTGGQEIIDNPVFKAHFIVAKSKGLTASENKIIQGAGLLSSYLLNRIDRRLLKSQYERFIYQPANSSLNINDSYGFKTTKIAFTPENIKDALLASGSIPMVMEGIRNIQNSPKGMYRDGGIIDYHFDFNVKNEGLILYPHFSSNPKAGWFDKNLTRKVSPENYDKIVMICPSQEFVNSLPYNKIPDRTDFTKMDSDTRIHYWKSVLADTEKLADVFSSFVDNQAVNDIKRF
ncbi:patatin-like phospholipase family protein [Pseudocolwellia sp. AS88]|uniref:patatin-like phospholipase family protein n=1 Tax=Pseudocolwellia sp. AS88 TaxID=3063958 RepID=UPI0026EC2B60|nr:patatin-like phospholipase family protein [Pseudocolwellia sp. AS88]MDO7084873.1 patatin-like phospholipase family protein [Pseudocolwellia sp. AS88]